MLTEYEIDNICDENEQDCYNCETRDECDMCPLDYEALLKEQYIDKLKKQRSFWKSLRKTNISAIIIAILIMIAISQFWIILHLCITLLK
ncbi:hypothetical protein DW019_01575 [Clostridium sp. AF37-5]|nr:hypothetical protein DW019_01575 [Clostridium sp. AF37-5]